MTGVAASDDERAVLGSALLNNALFPEVCAQLQVGDFQDPRHREALGALKLLWEAGQPLDYVTLVAKLRETHRLPKAGGHAYIAQLADDVSSKNLNPYIKAVLNASHKRRLSEAVNNGHAPAEIAALASEIARSNEQGWPPPTPFSKLNLPSFPTNVLPNWLRSYVEAEATATQTPHALAGLLTLAACAAAVAKKAIVQVKPGYTEPLNLFLVIALPPGNRKSAVFADVCAPLEEYEQEEAHRRTPEIAEATAKRKILEQRLRGVEAGAAKAGPEDREALTREALDLSRELTTMRVPASPRLLADDVSPERLATLLRDQNGRMAVLSPEGDIFDLMAGRYSANGMPNLGVFLKGHAGDTLRVDRVNRPSEFVQSPALTLGLAVQPDVLRGLVDKPGFRGRGLLGRFLYFLPKSPLGHRNTDPPAVPHPVREDYHKNLGALLRLPIGTDETGGDAPHVISLSKEAGLLWQEFVAWLEPQLGPEGDLAAISDWASKLAGAVARLAAILHLAKRASEGFRWSESIDVETMADAIQLAQCLIPHARAAFAEMGADPVVEDAKHLLDWVRRHRSSTFTKRDAFQGTKGRFRRVASLAAPLGMLEDHGYIRRLESNHHRGSGRPRSQMFEVNPRLAGNSEDCGNTEHRGNTSQDSHFNNSPSFPEGQAPNASDSSGRTPSSHNSHNPQNPPSRQGGVVTLATKESAE